MNFFVRQGFVITRQAGSHLRLVHKNGRKITIAVHNKPIAPGTFHAILRQANLLRDNFLKLYKNK